MQGPKLTIGDVEGRRRALEEEDFDFPREELRGGCLALYEGEKTQGTELSLVRSSNSFGVTWNTKKSDLTASNAKNGTKRAKLTGSSGNSGFCRVPIATGRSYEVRNAGIAG
jgi:hypothetical protein